MTELERARAFRKEIDAAGLMLTDEQAVKVKSLYPAWKYVIGKEAGDYPRMTRNGKLYRYIGALPYTYQGIYPPGEPGMESLFAVIDESHAGTIDDPIPYDGNMELFEGLYYSEEGIIYLCTRSTGQPVYNALKDLTGIYVEVAEE